MNNDLLRQLGFSRHYFHFKGKSAEKVVHELSRRTFLTDWCYLNPKLPNGKELCDLLVVFDDITIIWQIKDLKLDTQGRYKKSEVQKNLRQLSGARRALFSLRKPIELENPRRGRELFDPVTIKEVYLISVLLGPGEDAFSLLEAVNGYTVHVFTRDFTEIIMTELDTISDYTRYLREKERLAEKLKCLVVGGGEQELLAFYLINNRSFQPLMEAQLIMLEPGAWESLRGRPEYKAKKEEDRISYGWDSIINSAHTGSPEYERVARELARPNRFERCYLSKTFFDAYVKAHNDNQHDLFRRVVPMKGVTYCFLFADDPEPRERRKAMLGIMCYVARGKFPENKRVVGIAVEKKIRPRVSYDFCVFELPEWTDDHQKEMEEIQRKTGVFVTPTFEQTHEEEYPTASRKSGVQIPSSPLKYP